MFEKILDFKENKFQKLSSFQLLGVKFDTWTLAIIKTSRIWLTAGLDFHLITPHCQIISYQKYDATKFYFFALVNKKMTIVVAFIHFFDLRQTYSFDCHSILID